MGRDDPEGTVMLALSDASPVPAPIEMTADEAEWLALMDKLPPDDRWRMLRVAEAMAERPEFARALRAAQREVCDIDGWRAWVDATLPPA